MIYRRCRSLSLLFVLGAVPASASTTGSDAVVTGVTNIGIATVILSIALSLLLTLLLKPTVAALWHTLCANEHRRRVSRMLRRHSSDVLDDFLLQGAYGGLVHIDHAILLAGGVVCLRSKRASGTLESNARDPQWTLASGGTRRRFLNPIIQNQGRTDTLAGLVPNLPVKNLVVFDGNVSLPGSLGPDVIQLSDLDRYLSALEFKASSIDDWDAVWLTIKAAALTDDASRKDFDAQLSFG